MGLFSFIKDAGSKLFGESDEHKSENLTNSITEAGFEVENLEIIFEDEKVTIKGETDSKENVEKIILLIGNTEGVSEVDNQLTIKPLEEIIEEEIETIEEKIEEAEPKFYTVVAGDYLGKIAKEVYGDSSKYVELFEANKPMLKSPDEIYQGQVLRIPDLD